MSFSFGEKIKVTIFGQSHSEAIGVVIDGLPAGIKIDEDRINSFLERRRPGKNSFSTKRNEADKPEIISGIVDGYTCEAPICAMIKNTDVKSGDYDKIKTCPRPSHADFSAYMKTNGFNDIRGGGSFSGRMTAPLCFAGAICMQILEEKGILIKAHAEKIAGVCDDRFNPVDVCKNDFKRIAENDFPVLNSDAGKKMMKKIEEARLQSNSVGGVIECAVLGLPAGVGNPMFDGMENVISRAVFAVPAVKGIEFGLGFDCADMTGEENNDGYIVKDGKVVTSSNNHGGILGGISTGMPVIFRCAVKPTPSIGTEQNTVNLLTMKKEKITIEGRHDPCIVPRAVVCVEAACALATVNLL